MPVHATEPPPRDAQAREDVRIVAVDLQEMAPIEGVVQLQGDITDAATVQVTLGNPTLRTLGK